MASRYHSSQPYQPRAEDKQYMNPAFIAMISRGVETKLGRIISEIEREIIVTDLLARDTRRFAGKPPRAVYEFLVDQMVVKIRTGSCEADPEDVHDALLTEIGRTSEEGVVTRAGESADRRVALTHDERRARDRARREAKEFAQQMNLLTIFGFTRPADIQKIFNPQARIVKNRFVCDSQYRSLTDDGTTSISWNLVPNLNLTQGSTNILGKIRDITQIRVFPTRIPYVSNAVNDLKRITMLIAEMSPQSVVAQEGRRYHTVFDVGVSGDWIDLNPYYQNYGIYEFEKPVTTLESLTISFGSPLQLITFTPDRLISNITYGNPTTITTVGNIPNNLSPGNRVLMSGLTTTNNIRFSQLLMAFNNQYFSISTVNLYTFTIAIDTSGIIFPLTGTVAVTNGSENVTGTGTAFTAELMVGDTIAITDSSAVTRLYVVALITSPTALVITAPYGGITEGGLAAVRNDSVPGLQLTPYYDSKRIRIEIELSYIYPGDDVPS